MVPMTVGEGVCFTLVQTVLNLQWFGLYFYGVITVFESSQCSMETIVWTLNFNIFLEMCITLLLWCVSREPPLP